MLPLGKLGVFQLRAMAVAWTSSIEGAVWPIGAGGDGRVVREKENRSKNEG